MFKEMGERKFTEADLRRWAQQGLISQSQLEAILQAERPPAGVGREAHEGLNLPTVLYYLGTSLALVALGVFAGINWQDVNKVGRLVIIVGAMALLGSAGYLIQKRTPYRRGGGALFTIAVGTIPLLFFTLADFVAGPERDAIFNEEMLGQASLIQAVSLACIVGTLAWSRIGMVSLAVSAQAVALVATASIWWLGEDEFTAIAGILTALGALLIATGLAGQALKRAEEAFWFSLAGHGVFFYSFTSLAMSEWNGATASAYLLTFAGFVLVSALLRKTIFLVAGVAGVYVFVFRLIAETLQGSPFLPLAIALVGVSMVLLAIGYQRYRHWLPFGHEGGRGM